MNILRYIFIATLLLAFSFCVPIANAKHIIVVYDVSSSMYKLNVATGVSTKMESEDIRRVNDYLTNLLFTNASQSLRDRDDTHIKECDAAYVGKPLYQSGDIITYAEYAKKRYTKINRKQVRRDEFQRKLPDPMNLTESLYGKMSYLLRAEVEVYDKLLNEKDGETYWIFVTDGDVDRSAESDPNIGEVLKQHAAIEEKYDDPMIVGILVNKHVRIEVRRIQEQTPAAVFIANRTAPNEHVKEIQISKDDAGQFISETLIINTNNSDKIKFKLNSVNVKICDKNGKPLQNAKVTPVSLYGHSPPHEFQITLPENPEIAAHGNALKLEVIYNYNGKEKTYPMPPTGTVIKDIFVSDLDNPSQQVEEVELRLSEGAYLATLVVRSENPDKIPFQIGNIRCHVENKDDQTLCNASVKTTPQKLDEPFQVMVPNEKNLDLYGNKIVLVIDYHYNDTAISETIKLRFDPPRGNLGFLIVIFIILGVVGLAVVGFVLVRSPKKNSTEYQIMLAEVDQEGIPPNDGHLFGLADGETLSFGAVETDGLHLNVGSPAVLRCRAGEFFLCENVNDEKGWKIRSGETLPLKRNEGDEVQIYFKIENDKPQQQETDHTIQDDDLLPN